MVKGLPSKQCIWVRAPLLAHMLTTGIAHYNKLQQFLIYKGKKSKTENIFRQLLLARAKKNKSNFSSEMYICKYKTIPYLHLKIKHKRRGKRVFYRVSYLEKHLSEKKSVSKFGNFIRKNIGKKLELSLENEIESFYSNKSHPITIDRDTLHKLTKENAPRFWRKNKKKGPNFWLKKTKRNLAYLKLFKKRRFKSKINIKFRRKMYKKSRKMRWYDKKYDIRKNFKNEVPKKVTTKKRKILKNSRLKKSKNFILIKK